MEALEIQRGFSGRWRWRHTRFSREFWGMGGGGIGDLVEDFGEMEVEALEI